MSNTLIPAESTSDLLEAAVLKDKERRRKERLEVNQKMAQARKNVLTSSSYDIHKVCILSLFDSQAPQQNFRGFMNLAFLLLFVVNFRLVVENLLKYGILFLALPKPSEALSWPSVVCGFSLPIFPFAAHLIENFHRTNRNTLRYGTVDLLHGMNIFLCFVTVCFVILSHDCSLAAAILLMFVSIILVMKLISYAHVMHSDRIRERIYIERMNKHKKTDDKKNNKNDNITIEDKEWMSSINEFDYSLQHMFYFMMAPTMCYQHKYPRYPEKVRKTFVLKRIGELIFSIVLITILVRQYVEPTMNNALKFMEADPLTWNYLGILERVLKLSIPNLIVWLVGFFALFHSFLNLTAELLRFGDRVFYRDWWNATNFKEYWNRWNIPVHNWVIRHLYAPLLRHNISNTGAQTIVFMFSAMLHEFVISVPAHQFKIWAFLGMMMQAPFIIFYKKLDRVWGKGSVWGNLFFWGVFCVLGQPAIVLMYYHNIITQS